jgi:MFS family permease
VTAQPQTSGGSRTPGGGAPDAADPRAYGWVVVAASFVFLTLGGGFGFYSLSTYAEYLTSHNDISLTATSTGSTVFLLVSGAFGLVVARMVPRSIRLPLYLGTIVCATGLPLLGHAHNAWELWLVYALYGVGSAGLGVITASTLVIRWFPAAPGRPLAIATTGMSVGGAVVAPLVATAVENVGLPRTGLVMAAVLLVVLLPLTTFVVRYPRAVRAGTPVLPEAVEEFGDDHAVEQSVQPSPRGSAPPGRKTLVFAVTCLAFGLLMLSQVGAVTHMITLASDRDLTNGPLALSVLAFTSVAGRLLGIPVLPAIGLRTFTIVNALIQAVAMVTIASATTNPMLLVGAGLLGATVGNTVVLIPLSILDSFGLAEYPRLYARANLFTTFGVACGPLLLGALHGLMGGYTWPLVLLGAGSAVAALLLALIPREHHSD